MIFQIDIETIQREQIIDITDKVEKIIPQDFSWLCVVYTPHTTCWITINEGYDPDVAYDILTHLKKLVPLDGWYRHFEWNSDAHIKSSLIWVSQTLIVENGKLVLWRWQKILFCEFDWARQRKVLVKFM